MLKLVFHILFPTSYILNHLALVSIVINTNIFLCHYCGFRASLYTIEII